jgi:hypothetical protein
VSSLPASASGRPRQARIQVPPGDRRQRHPPDGRAVGRQHPRFAAARAAGGRRPGGHRAARTTRSATSTPGKPHADKGDDYPICRRVLRHRGISPRIARRGVESSQRLGRHRWKVGLSGPAADQPAPDRPLRAPRRHCDRVAASGLRADLRPQAPTVVHHRYLAVGAASSPDAWPLPARAFSRCAAS